MAKVNMTTEMNIAADEIWKLIGGFNSLPDWHPQIANSVLKEAGKIRELTLVGGGKIIEKLDEQDATQRFYSYTIIESPLPIANYRATIKLIEQASGNTTVQWSSEFDVDEGSEQDAVNIIKGIYQAGFDHLKKLFNC